MVGNFDGVHRGHQWVLQRGLEAARSEGLSPIVLTFHPHPSVVLGRGVQPVLTPLERKIDLLARTAPDLRVVVEPFTLELANASPRAFAADLLLQKLQAKIVMVGENFRFGQARSGDSSVLAALGRELGFRALSQPLHADAEGVISSTRIRELIVTGSVRAAEQLLGRPHALSGRVEHGDQRARKLGIPSANLAAVPELMPARGIYAVLVDLLGPGGYARLAPGVANVGIRPTEGEGPLRAEVHALGFSGDLYGRSLRMHLVERMRDEVRFDSMDALRAQLDRDKIDAASVLASRTPAPDASGAWH
jgi:riboflavin kinase / FMN adenylyltransferase